MPDFSITEFLRPGDLVAIGEATAEPRTLVARFLDAARDIDDLTALCGYALDDIWHSVPDGHPTVMSYAAHGSLRKLAATGQLQILPCHLSSVVRFIRNGTLPVDVVLIQLPPADADGFHSLGATVGYLVDALDSARVVLAEINPNMPRTNSSRRIHQSRITATVTSDIPLPGSPTRPATEVDRTIAANVATLIPDGASLQLGVGAIPAEITKVIRERSGLRIRSNLIGDWIFDLVDSGASTSAWPGRAPLAWHSGAGDYMTSSTATPASTSCTWTNFWRPPHSQPATRSSSSTPLCKSTCSGR